MNAYVGFGRRPDAPPNTLHKTTVQDTYDATVYGKLVKVPYDPIQQPLFAATAGGKSGMEQAREKVIMRCVATAGAYME